MQHGVVGFVLVLLGLFLARPGDALARDGDAGALAFPELRGMVAEYAGSGDADVRADIAARLRSLPARAALPLLAAVADEDRLGPDDVRALRRLAWQRAATAWSGPLAEHPVLVEALADRHALRTWWGLLAAERRSSSTFAEEWVDAVDLLAQDPGWTWDDASEELARRLADKLGVLATFGWGRLRAVQVLASWTRSPNPALSTAAVAQLRFLRGGLGADALLAYLARIEVPARDVEAAREAEERAATVPEAVRRAVQAFDDARARVEELLGCDLAIDLRQAPEERAEVVARWLPELEAAQRRAEEDWTTLPRQLVRFGGAVRLGVPGATHIPREVDLLVSDGAAPGSFVLTASQVSHGQLGATFGPLDVLDGARVTLKGADGADFVCVERTGDRAFRAVVVHLRDEEEAAAAGR